jgi:hypothetical protein
MISNAIRSPIKLSVILITSMTIWSFTTNAHASDYEKVREFIITQERLVNDLGTAEDTFSQTLIEPLVQLAKLQSSANRLKDAQQTIAKALHTTRINYGLYDERQLPLLQLDIENTIALSDWNSAREKLDHYSWLLTEQIELPVTAILDTVLWLVSAHKQGSFAALEVDRAWHITRATMLSEALVSLTQRAGLHNTLPHVQSLYGLTQLYYLEAKAILAGGPPGHALRELHASISNVETRSSSQRRLYKSGLDRLVEIKSIIEASNKFNAEAAAMVNLRIADWNALFGRSENLTQDYELAIASLKRAGVSTQTIDTMLKQPTHLPRPNLSLSADEEIYTTRINVISLSQDTTPHLSMYEASANIPGVITEQNPHEWSRLMLTGWGSVVAKIKLDPDLRKAVKNSGYRTDSNVTPKQINLITAHNIEDLVLENARQRMEILGFRPAFVDGKPVASTLLVTYRLRDSLKTDQSNLLSLL